MTINSIFGRFPKKERQPMRYVFVFVGEFGYELLNWQGRVRKFAREIGSQDEIICCGRPGAQNLYELAAEYVDISGSKLYSSSRACGYGATPTDSSGAEYSDRGFLAALKEEISILVTSKLSAKSGDETTFVYSFEENKIFGSVFGVDHVYFGTNRRGDIYDLIEFWNNEYVQIKSNAEMISSEVREIIGGEKYVLIQNRYRAENCERLPNDHLVEKFARHIPVVCINFDTIRAEDSKSALRSGNNITNVSITSLNDQIALIENALHCIFTTEGDFGSHIYLPPLIGRDVTVLAAKDVYRLGSSPIKIWNEFIFKFGGKIRAYEWRGNYNINDATDFDVIVNDSLFREYNNKCQSLSQELNDQGLYLWPRTPISDDYQERIVFRCGVSDLDPNAENSRPSRINKKLESLVASDCLSRDFSVLDVACGDAAIATRIKHAWPFSHIAAIDINKGAFSQHEIATTSGVKIFKTWIQVLFRQEPASPVDVVLLMNTYRDWGAAELQTDDKDLPTEIDNWLYNYARVVILTATQKQVDAFIAAGWKAEMMGKGEDESLMLALINPKYVDRAIQAAVTPTYGLGVTRTLGSLNLMSHNDFVIDTFLGTQAFFDNAHSPRQKELAFDLMRQAKNEFDMHQLWGKLPIEIHYESNIVIKLIDGFGWAIEKSYDKGHPCVDWINKSLRPFYPSLEFSPVAQHEASALKLLNEHSLSPKLIALKSNSIIMSFSGLPLTMYKGRIEFESDQYEVILDKLGLLGFRHNDMLERNVLVNNGRVFLCDFTLSEWGDLKFVHLIPDQSWARAGRDFDLLYFKSGPSVIKSTSSVRSVRTVAKSVFNYHNLGVGIFPEEEEKTPFGSGERYNYDRMYMIASNYDFYGKSVLDIGCNSGWFTNQAKSLGAKSAVGLDFQGTGLMGAAIAYAKAYEERHENGSRFHNMNVENVDFSSLALAQGFPGFDAIFLLSVLHHIADKERLMSLLIDNTREVIFYEDHEFWNDIRDCQGISLELKGSGYRFGWNEDLSWQHRMGSLQDHGRRIISSFMDGPRRKLLHLDRFSDVRFLGLSEKRRPLFALFK